MKLRFHCGMNDWTGKSLYDTPGECSGQIEIEIDRDIFKEEGATVFCPKCNSQLDSDYHSEEA